MQDISPPLLHAATLALAVFGPLAVIDGIYVHLIRLKLHTRAASRVEHLWHSLAAVLAVPGLYAIFAVASGGKLLWLGISVAALGQLVEWLDMQSEKESRAAFGGLSSFEYILHSILTATRNVALALSLAARPASAFSLSSPNVIGTMPPTDAALVWAMIVGAVGMAVLHLWLAVRSDLERPATA